MDQLIKSYKKIYLETPIPMDIDEGLQDVMGRIDTPPTRPFYYSRIFITVGVLLLVTTGVAGAVFFAPPESNLHGVKVAAQNAINKTFNTSLEDLKLNIPSLAPQKPSATPSTTPEKKNNNNTPHSDNANEKANPRSVKGVNNGILPTKTHPNSSQNPSFERRNENAAQPNGNASQGKGNSEEKSNNGKNKD